MTRSSIADLREGVILVVDDTPAMLEMCARMLRIDGHCVHTASSGAGALLMLDTLTPDLIILDCMMPKMSGLELLQRLRSHENTRTTPVMLLTASGDDHEIIQSALSLGADDYLSKTANRKTLCSRVATLIGIQRQRRANNSPRGAT